MEENFLHKPVLLKEAIAFLNLAPQNIIVDATVGGGGHAIEIVKKIAPNGLLIGIDKDNEALDIASRRLEPYRDLVKLINKDFRYTTEILSNMGVDKIDGILFDLGISSIQMERPERGFSIKNNGPLDMRMDMSLDVTAQKLVNRLREDELSEIIKNFGEERFHKRIARNIVNTRVKKPITTTFELAQIVVHSMPAGYRYQKIHPATRTFQAIRIMVNNELDSLKEALLEMPSILKKGARVCVISFHSLEDRIVKNVFKDFHKQGVLKIVTKKPVIAQEEEVLENPRARSAKLRVAEKA